MQREIDELIDSYDNGRLTRRQLGQALLSLAVSPTASAQQRAPVLRGLTVEHVQLTVGDLARSRDFM
jgi:hypothetical protein